MTNPWLTISAEDYEAHMASPEVGQLQLLNQLFKTVLEAHRPSSLAIVGCSSALEVQTLAAVGRNPSHLSGKERALLLKTFEPYVNKLAFYRGVR